MSARHAASIAALLVACGLIAAACGGTSGPGVASLGSSTTTTSPAAESSNTTNYLDAVKYAQCMRTHGVPNMPDPNSQGGFLFHGSTVNGVKVGFTPNTAQFVHANNECQHLLPNGGQPTAAELARMLTQALKYVRCMRANGVPNMPDPTEGGGGISLRIPGGPHSPGLQKAMKACRSLGFGGNASGP